MTTQLAGPAETPAAAITEDFEVLLVSDDLEPGYSVFCLSMPGCVSEGDDREHALEMITEAIELSLEFPPDWTGIPTIKMRSRANGKPSAAKRNPLWFGLSFNADAHTRLPIC